jgi:uncharacterized protein (DUF697 family)
VADLDKLRAVATRWAPAAVSAFIGAVAGAVLAGFGNRWGDLAVPIIGLAASVSAGVAAGWMWCLEKAASARADRELAAAWRRKYAEREHHIYALQQKNERLTDAVARLTPGEVVSLLHERMGDHP